MTRIERLADRMLSAFVPRAAAAAAAPVCVVVVSCRACGSSYKACFTQYCDGVYRSGFCNSCNGYCF